MNCTTYSASLRKSSLGSEQNLPSRKKPSQKDFLLTFDNCSHLMCRQQSGPVDISTESEQIQRITFVERFIAQLSGFFGTLALMLARLGLYGLLSYEVAQRTREIGIRMAVGARRPDVVRLVLGQGIALVLEGAVVGLAASLGLARLMSSFLYGVHSSDPATLIAVALVLVTVAFAACYLPVRKATRVDPLVALRYE